MTTREPELTEPVDLCDASGQKLNIDAIGWSRQPLHRANLSRRWGRNKRWDYWGILLGDGFISLTFASLDYLGLVAVDWGDFTTGARGRAAHLSPGSRKVRLADRSGERPLELRTRLLDATIIESAEGTRLRADWRRKGGGRDRFDLLVERDADHESVNVVVPWSERRFQFTSKHQALAVTGTATLAGVERRVGGTQPAWATLDVGRGRWPYRSEWNWAGGAGKSVEGATLGLQFGGKWTAGTPSTENGIIVDGRVSKIGQELEWDYRIDRPLEPWRLRAPDRSVDLTLTPVGDKPSKINLGAFMTAGDQVFGSWSGTVTDDDGRTHTLGPDVIGFAEEIHWRW